MKSCPGSQYWGLAFIKTGHEVRLLPAQFVKPYLKANKNDFNDAGAIAEAGGRASMRCVPLKTNEQLEPQALQPFPCAFHHRAHRRGESHARAAPGAWHRDSARSCALGEASAGHC